MNNDDWVRITDNIKKLMKYRRKPLNFNDFYKLYQEKYSKLPSSERVLVKLAIMDLVSQGYLNFDKSFRIVKNRS